MNKYKFFYEEKLLSGIYETKYSNNSELTDIIKA